MRYRGQGGRAIDTSTPSDTATRAAGPAVAPVQPSQDASATAFVFDQLSPEGRALALQVAQRLATRMRDDEWLGVFGLDASLVVAHGFSRDRAGAREAVGRLMGRPLRTADPSAATSTITGGVSLDPSVPVTAGADSAGALPTFEARRRYMEDGGPAETLLAQIEWRMALAYDEMSRDLQGQSTVIGLRAVAAALARAPGRKSLVLFAEGLPVTERNRPHFAALIATANSAGVSFYVIDAAGLRVHSAIAEGVRQQDVAGRTGLGDLSRGRGAWTRDLERQADVVRSDGNAALWRLARETGGVLIENTNSVDVMARRLNEDQEAHYLLAYSPLNSRLDATYRQVRVTVKKRGLTAVHRSGYWAVP
jgi:VWFA-related protein